MKKVCLSITVIAIFAFIFTGGIFLKEYLEVYSNKKNVDTYYQEMRMFIGEEKVDIDGFYDSFYGNLPQRATGEKESLDEVYRNIKNVNDIQEFQSIYKSMESILENYCKNSELSEDQIHELNEFMETYEQNEKTLTLIAQNYNASTRNYNSSLCKFPLKYFIHKFDFSSKELYIFEPSAEKDDLTIKDVKGVFTI